MTTRTITAIFDSADDAQRAQDRLLALGLTSSDVQIINQQGTDVTDDDHRGFWETLKDLFTDDDRATYAEGVRRGGYLLTARVQDEYADEAFEILEASDAVDLEQRSEQWRAEGWSGAEPMTEPMAATAASPRRRAAEAEEAIPIVRERLSIGKREVDRGGVRVRSYIVEEPVNEQVELREEHVEVERRPVGERLRENADDLLRERTIELSEKAEEAVIAKEAEVTEELVVRKFEGHRTEGVSDTVRHTEVDVEDTRKDAPDVPPESRTRSRGTPKRPSR